MYIPKLEIYKYCRIPSGSNEKEPYPNLLSRKSLGIAYKYFKP